MQIATNNILVQALCNILPMVCIVALVQNSKEQLLAHIFKIFKDFRTYQLHAVLAADQAYPILYHDVWPKQIFFHAESFFPLPKQQLKKEHKY